MRGSRFRYGVMLLMLLVLVVPAATKAPRASADGPGFGNLTYHQDELFAPIARVDTSSGVPPNPNGKPFGLNIGLMHNGYFVTLFAPDSGDGPGGLLFYDISDPRKLRLVNRVYEPEGRTSELREAHAIGASNSYPGSYVVLQSGRGIEFWDWTDVARPALLSRLRLPGVEFGDYGSVAWQLFWQAPYVYVAVAEQGMYIVDATDPRNPVLVDRGPGRSNPIPPSQLGGFSVGPITAVGNLLVISGMETENSLATLDIGDPKNPRLLASLGEGVPLYYASSFNGGRIITSQRGGGARMHVFDVRDPSRITLVNDALEIDDQLYNATQDQYVFQGAQTEVVKVDVANPDDYRIVGRGSLGVPKPDHGQVTPIGNLLFIGNDHGTGSGFIVHQTAPDQTAPRVNMVSPADGAVGQPLTTRVGISFSDNIDLRSVTAESFVVRPLGGAPLTGKYSHQTAIVNFFPDEPLLPNTTYEVVLSAGGVRDWAGNPTDQTFTSRFSTGAAVSNLRVKLATSVPQVAGAPVSLSASVSGANPASPVEFAWIFGDGASQTPFSASPNASHSYSAAGHYPVSVIVRNGAQVAGDSMTQIIHNPLTAGRPTNASSVIYADGRVWVVNSDNDTIAALDPASNTRLFEQPAGDNPRTLARASDGAIWVVNQDSATISVHAPAGGALLRTIDLPRGSAPYGIAFHPAGDSAFVTLQGSGALLKIDRASGVVLGRLPLAGPVRGVAVSHDGARVYVSRFISPATRGEVYEVDPSALVLVRTIPLAYDKTPDGENRGRGVPNYLSALAISPDGRRLWAPSKKDNTARGQLRDGNPLTFESTVRTIASQIDIASGSEVVARRIDFNDRDMAQAVAFSPLGNYAYVALQGSNMVHVHDAYVGARAAILFDTGLAPQGLALSPDGDRLFVHNLLSRTVRVYDVAGINRAREYTARPLATIATVAEERLPPDLLRGKQIFYNARDRRMSRDGYLSCASCHLDGGGDGQVWDLTDRGEGLRNTLSLRGPGVREGNLHWTGNFDELQDFEHDIRRAFEGTGFLSDADYATGTRSRPLGDPKAGLSADLDALAAYIRSLASVGPSPFRSADGALTAEAQAGRLIFQQRGCVACHAGSAFTDSRTGMLHAVGTLKPSSGMRAGQPLTGLDTPALVGLWASAPYLHDGSAATLLDVLTTADSTSQHGDLSGLDDTQRQQLVAYLLQIDDTEVAAPPSHLFAARLTGGQVTPAVATLSSGRASVVLLDDGTNALVTLRLEGLADSVTSVTLNGPAGPGMQAPALLRLPSAPLSAQPITLTLQQVEYLRAGQLYLNVATEAQPDGVLRGQIGTMATAPGGTSYLSDLVWTTMHNGWGPVERDQTNGSTSVGDGRPITLDGAPYAKGLGVHAASELVYRLGGTCTQLQSDIGIDDIVGGAGSVVFQVWADGQLAYDSGLTTGSDPVRRIDLAIGGVDELRLLVTDGGDGDYGDHAIWAGARVNCPTWHLSLPMIAR